jgi:hypothetical protein
VYGTGWGSCSLLDFIISAVYNIYTWYYQAKESEAVAARQVTVPVEAFPPVISVIVNPPSPVMSDDNDEVSLRFSEDNMNRCEHPVYTCC